MTYFHPFQLLGNVVRPEKGAGDFHGKYRANENYRSR